MRVGAEGANRAEDKCNSASTEAIGTYEDRKKGTFVEHNLRVAYSTAVGADHNNVAPALILEQLNCFRPLLWFRLLIWDQTWTSALYSYYNLPVMVSAAACHYS